FVDSMHGLSANYSEFLGSHEAEQMADRGSGSIFASPESRGPDGSYQSYAEADVFDMWNDVARHYHLNPPMADVTGYSMGGGGTYRLASKWPDLWARAFPIVGPPTIRCLAPRITPTGCRRSRCAVPAAPASSTSAHSLGAPEIHRWSRCRSAITSCTEAPTDRSRIRSGRSGGGLRRLSRKPTSS